MLLCYNLWNFRVQLACILLGIGQVEYVMWVTSCLVFLEDETQDLTWVICFTWSRRYILFARRPRFRHAYAVEAAGWIIYIWNLWNSRHHPDGVWSMKVAELWYGFCIHVASSRNKDVKSIKMWSMKTPGLRGSWRSSTQGSRHQIVYWDLKVPVVVREGNLMWRVGDRQSSGCCRSEGSSHSLHRGYEFEVASIVCVPVGEWYGLLLVGPWELGWSRMFLRAV